LKPPVVLVPPRFHPLSGGIAEIARLTGRID